MDQFMGMQMLMGILKLPSYPMYWMNEIRINTIADVMPINRYKALRRYIHVVDNSKKDEADNKNDKLFKIRPILEMVRDNCHKIEPEPVHSIDEQIIPAKTKHSGIRQYNPKKPHKWGLKCLFDLAQLCLDNWFCTLSLCLKLKEIGILTTATIRTNRIAKCPLLSEKDLKKQGRGSFSYKVDANSGLLLLRWFDNKCVHMTSTYCSANTSGNVKRWDQKNRKHIQVPCPQVVKEYNTGMGGVDLSDMLISLYRIPMKTKRWYLRVLVHCMDICKINAWLLYRRHGNQLNISQRSQLNLLQFSSQIANAIIMKSKRVDRPIGRPIKKLSTNSDLTETRGRKVQVPTPQNDIRYDEFGHWPNP
ncbi:piggyBac transposable element-derived protein 3-like [Hydra vulgaris]|uniref:piggyBac transposable element-derived protein 3-like n=1 Tax=Hydra vulgaris TaxID=6087 RepID=UPI0032EA7065